ncbi:MAG: HlyD family efflux transporter periplasmic adaptor subunit [Acidobacteria bacterium]|nr:HlyD family efflux transporter periplasmic adaptor subunit [Acidobacteriota bacterium]
MNSEPTSPKLEFGAAHADDARQRSGSLRFWILAATVTALAVVGLYFVRRTHSIPTRLPVSVFAGQRISTPQLRLTGKTQAATSRAILAPLLSGQQFSTLTVVHMIPSGSRVKKGDILAEFDRQAQLRDFVDKQAQVEDQNGKVLQAQAAELAAKAKDETELEQAETALSNAELNMRKIELVSRIDAEKYQEDLDEARATLAQLKQTFLLKRKAGAASIRILEIQRDRTRETMAHAQANAALMQARSPIEGIVVYTTIWKEGTMGEVQEGDQVRPGVSFMQVVDPSVMEVHVQVNQEDLAGLRVGEKARVHLDAYPDLAFSGRLESIDPLGKRGDFSAKVHNFSATFSIEGNDPRLMPDLSAAVDVDRAGASEGAMQ